MSSDYFATVGTRILRGRAFTPEDGAGADRVMIVSDFLARSLWPNEEAIGRCIIVWRRTAPCARIIGIAANTHTRDIAEEPGLQYYVPFEQAEFGGIASLVARPRGDPRAMVGTMRRALLEEDSTLAYLHITTLQESMRREHRNAHRQARRRHGGARSVAGDCGDQSPPPRRKGSGLQPPPPALQLGDP